MILLDGMVKLMIAKMISILFTFYIACVSHPAVMGMD